MSEKKLLKKVKYVNLYPNPIPILDPILDPIPEENSIINIFPILEKEIEKIDWSLLSDNPYDNNVVFDIEGNKIGFNDFPISNYFKKYVREELMMMVFHPKNIDKFKGWGFEDEDE